MPSVAVNVPAAAQSTAIVAGARTCDAGVESVPLVFNLDWESIRVTDVTITAAVKANDPVSVQVAIEGDAAVTLSSTAAYGVIRIKCLDTIAIENKVTLTLSGTNAALFTIPAEISVSKATAVYAAPLATEVAVLTIGTVVEGTPNEVAITATCPFNGMYYYEWVPTGVTAMTEATAAADYTASVNGVSTQYE